MNSKSQDIVFSGIQPTGKMHVGNYLGMLQNSVALQEQYENCIYCIVDLHSITEDFDPKTKQDQIHALALDMLAVGLDPSRSIIFQQSDVLEHANLAWILNTLTPLGELERMTQFKDKSSRQQENINAGLFDYPVLMAADILLYKTTLVPVGEDQTQHIELARKVARKFNNRFGDTFPVPKALYTKTPRVMSLLQPEKKMSKSLGDAHVINISDEPEVIEKKLARAVTDTGKEKQMSAGTKNLFAMLEMFGEPEQYAFYVDERKKGTIRYSDFKKNLAKVIAHHFSDYRSKREELGQKADFVMEVLESGKEKASAIAQEVYKETKEKIGLK